MKLAVVDLIDVTSNNRNRELFQIKSICEHMGIEYQEFPVNVLPVGDWFDSTTVCIVRGAIKTRKMWLNKLTEMEHRGCIMVNTRECIDFGNFKIKFS